MTGLILPIFPDGSLASSVIPTVWIGVFVVCLLNQRWGWVLSGLVVPGYLVPLLLIKPMAAMIVLLEASLTYGLFWLLSERLSGPTRWSSFFGRDRFMGLILVSLAVRLLLDGWLLPILATELNANFGWEVDWENNLHSFGLIVIALLANQLWKPGYVRGLTQALVMIGATFLIVRYGLMEFTNFRIGAVAYLYEDFATSILASPKAYIILIVTCFIASRMNLRYGWDFSGILIPALLALQWYQPWKILTSICEALIIYFAASALLSSRFFAGATVEGASKLLLFFNISFAYKLLLGHALAYSGIEDRITDYYGFGYLLPTLIAIKAHDKNILTRLTRATVQVSLTGALLGSFFGFGLTLAMPSSEGRFFARPMEERSANLPVVAKLAAQTVGMALIERRTGDAPAIAESAAPSFRAALELVDSEGDLVEARASLRRSGYRLEAVAGGQYAIAPERGGGFLILFNPNAARRLALTVPEPTSEPQLALASVALMKIQDARYLVIGGTSKPGSSAELGKNPAAEFQRALRLPVLSVSAAPRGRGPQLRLAGSSSRLVDFSALGAALRDMNLDFSARGQSQLSLPFEAVQQLLAGARWPPAKITGKYSPAELAFIRFALLDPLIAEPDAALPGARATAETMGFQFASHRENGSTTLILKRTDRSGETYFLRPRSPGPIIRLASGTGLAEPGIALFERLNARAILVSSPTRALERGDSQLLALVTHALHHGRPGGLVTLQLRPRPLSYANANPSALLVAPDRIEARGGLGDTLVTLLRRAGFEARLVDRDAQTAGLEMGPAQDLRYAQQAFGGRAALLWMPAGARVQQ